MSLTDRGVRKKTENSKQIVAEQHENKKKQEAADINQDRSQQQQPPTISQDGAQQALKEAADTSQGGTHCTQQKHCAPPKPDGDRKNWHEDDAQWLTDMCSQY